MACVDRRPSRPSTRLARPAAGPIRKGVPPSLRRLPALLLAAILAVSFARPAWPGVFLSELCDPQNNYPTDRFIEIYNSGPGDVDLANWSVVAVANNLDVCTWPLSGTLAAGQAKVCGGPSTVTGFIVHFQSAVWATTAGYMNWNGRVGDGARLKDASSTVIDQVVATGTLFENADLVRIPVRVLRINDAVMWASPIELFCEIALRVRAESPFRHNFYFGYTNGWLGYLPTAQAFKDGGYEPRTSPFSEQVERDFTDGVIAYIQGLPRN